MFKFLTAVTFVILFFFFPDVSFAESNSFVSIVNPVRGYDFWNSETQKIEDAALGQIEILKQTNLPATWLLRFDVLDENKLPELLNNNSSDEKGLFLEVTPSWAKQSGVEYHESENWHSAGSAFLTGYEIGEREKLIDAAFLKFKNVFGYYPKTVGAWWVDSYSLNYMQKKYGIISSLIVSDQYSTDNYQIWGQYFSTPYYPDLQNALHPAQSVKNKIPVVIIQWAARDPVNGYGNGVFESTFSVQANDYKDFHKLDTNYFSKLLDIYLNQKFNQFGQLVIGLENAYQWDKYKNEYSNQINALVEKANQGQLKIVTTSEFAKWYQASFPELSPPHLIEADDPLGSFKKVVWFMNPYYRAGWFYNHDGSVFRDIRQYIDGDKELCLEKKCDELNFATSATRVLDDVSFGHKWVIDQGKIKNFNISEENENFVISYENEAGSKRKIEFLPRDIGIDGKISSIDTTILEVIKKDIDNKKIQSTLKTGQFNWSIVDLLIALTKFVGFLTICCIIPGLVFTFKILDKSVSFLQRFFLSTACGLVALTLLFYLASLLHIRAVIYGYFFIMAVIFFKYFFKPIKENILLRLTGLADYGILLMTLAGTIFQTITTFKSGLSFSYGLGFWGPNTHDGVWHIALINQLIKNVPPENPIFAGLTLKNYHFFYDLLVAASAYISRISAVDLVFRFYPIVFSLMLGVGTYYLIKTLFASWLNDFRLKVAAIFSLYFVYFAGSFGWIVEYLREKHLGGESAFWANQSISFNLNPPFAISLIIVIATLQLLPRLDKKNVSLFLILTLLVGSLISFKAYANILVLSTLLITGILKKSSAYLMVFAAGLIVSTILFVSNFSLGQKLLVFSPFWFVHSMIDSPDRVGWFRLSLTRNVGFSEGNWFKILVAETLSLLIFIFGNLGTRLFALLSLFKLRTIFQNREYLFLFVISFLALIIPFTFIQTGNPWNTIQFVYYFLYVSAAISGIFVLQILTRVNKVIALPLIFFSLAITPINSWVTASGYLSNQPHAFISESEVDALQFLKSQSEGIVLTFLYDNNLKKKIAEPWPLFVYDSTAYVSAISGKSVYLEDEPQNQILLIDYKKRLVASKDFFLNPSTTGLKFLQDNSIKYIYLPKIFNVTIDDSVGGIKNIFENDQVVIYKLND